jgi:hypothetical protein
MPRRAPGSFPRRVSHDDLSDDETFVLVVVETAMAWQRGAYISPFVIICYFFTSYPISARIEKCMSGNKACELEKGVIRETLS